MESGNLQGLKEIVLGRAGVRGWRKGTRDCRVTKTDGKYSQKETRQKSSRVGRDSGSHVD